MQGIQEKILKLDKILTIKQSSATQFLNEGITSEEIIEFFREYGLNIKNDDGLTLLYSWHNGTTTTMLPTGNFYLFPTFYFMSIEEISNTIIEYEPFYLFTESGLIPFFSSGDDYLSIAINSQQLGPEIYYSTISNTEVQDLHTSIFDSIDSMLRTITQCFEENIFRKKDFYFEISDYHQYKKIATSDNPLSKYWKLQQW
ncbi:MAG: SMI1/KNR4 family protein [Pedobacter sp.]|nr:MAG: SMI1/KNR4 family protein [Pedobacter sp.]